MKTKKPFGKIIRSKDRTKKYFVRVTEAGVSVSLKPKQSVITQAILAPEIRQFKPDEGSEIPDPIWKAALLDLAMWWTRKVARTGQYPNPKQERRRRLKFLKAASERWSTHATVKGVVHRLKYGVKKPVFTRPEIRLPYIFVYDPKGRLDYEERTPFVVHTAYCERMDKDRRKVLKSGGASWIVEGTKPERAVGSQIAEFDIDSKGYDRTDFTIHRCERDDRPKKITSKTVLERIGKRKRG